MCSSVEFHQALYKTKGVSHGLSAFYFDTNLLFGLYIIILISNSLEEPVGPRLDCKT